MGQWVHEVMVALVADAISSAIKQIPFALGRSASDSAADLSASVRADVSVAGILEGASIEVARSGALANDRIGDRLRIFLVSPEAQAIVKQICLYTLASDSRGQVDSLRSELETSAVLYLGVTPGQAESLVEAVFEPLVAACNRAVALAIDAGILSAHELRSEARFKALMAEMRAVQDRIGAFNRTTSPDLDKILQFETQYRNQVGHRHGFITPPHVDAARRLPLDDLYVVPQFLKGRNVRDPGAEKPIEFKVFLPSVNRTVLLGNPGGGKSTLAQKVCHDLAMSYDQRLVGDRSLTPMLVVLRDYGADKKSQGRSIMRFIEATASSKYQVEPPLGAIEYLLLNGRTLVVFDGLDELLDTSHRREVSEDVEAFCNLYPSVPVLVTSREVGYEQAPLAEPGFTVYRLAPFSESQVEEYARKWFTCDVDLGADEGSRKATSFLRESKIVPDLRSNPLMLALMCNIYRGDNYIPRNRPDVYEKCAVMMFERWDKSRGIVVQLPFEAHISPAIKYLAYWIYSGEALQSGVTEAQLIEKATEYLWPRRFEDKLEAERAAAEFIAFCRGRAWVFSDTGTTKEGDSLYQFTHRTFLEYFAAAYLTRIHPTPSELSGILLPRIARREWDVVAQVAFQLHNKNIEGAGDELLGKLIEASDAASGEKVWHYLSFAARCLEFIVPSPAVTRALTRSFMKKWISWARESENGSATDFRASSQDSSEPPNVFTDLCWAATENLPPIGDVVEAEIVAALSNSDTEALALEVALHMPPFAYGRAREFGEERAAYWGGVRTRIGADTPERLVGLAPRLFLAAVAGLWKHQVTVGQVIAWHGIESLFRVYPYRMFPSVRHSPPADYLTGWFIRPHRAMNWDLVPRIIEGLRVVGSSLFKKGPPWALVSKSDFVPIHLVSTDVASPDAIRHVESMLDSLDSAAWFGAVAVYATLLEEAAKASSPEQVGADLRRADLQFIVRLSPVFRARFQPNQQFDVSGALYGLGLPANQVHLLQAWAAGKVDFARSSVENPAVSQARAE